MFYYNDFANDATKVMAVSANGPVWLTKVKISQSRMHLLSDTFRKIFLDIEDKMKIDSRNIDSFDFNIIDGSEDENGCIGLEIKISQNEIVGLAKRDKEKLLEMYKEILKPYMMPLDVAKAFKFV